LCAARNYRGRNELQRQFRAALPGPSFALLTACSEACRSHPAASRFAPWEEDIVIVKITANDKNNPPGKLADAELHFTDGPLEGLKLIGFSVWERRSGSGRNVTFPARTYSVNGERRTFALLRPINDATGQDRVRELILQAYAEYEESQAVAT
jgi:hypothetical protein